MLYLKLTNKAAEDSVGGTNTGGDSKYSLLNPLEGSLTIIIPHNRLTLPQESKNGLADICQSGNESADVLKSAQETSDLPLCPRRGHVKNGSDLIWVYLYASLTDHVS